MLSLVALASVVYSWMVYTDNLDVRCEHYPFHPKCNPKKPLRVREIGAAPKVIVLGNEEDLIQTFVFRIQSDWKMYVYPVCCVGDSCTGNLHPLRDHFVEAHQLKVSSRDVSGEGDEPDNTTEYKFMLIFPLVVEGKPIDDYYLHFAVYDVERNTEFGYTDLGTGVELLSHRVTFTEDLFQRMKKSDLPFFTISMSPPKGISIEGFEDVFQIAYASENLVRKVSVGENQYAEVEVRNIVSTPSGNIENAMSSWGFCNKESQMKSFQCHVSFREKGWYKVLYYVGSTIQNSPAVGIAVEIVRVEIPPISPTPYYPEATWDFRRLEGRLRDFDHRHIYVDFEVQFDAPIRLHYQKPLSINKMEVVIPVDAFVDRKLDPVAGPLIPPKSIYSSEESGVKTFSVVLSKTLSCRAQTEETGFCEQEVTDLLIYVL